MQKILITVLSLIIFVSLFAGCYNDKKEQLFPVIDNSCDTVNVTYSKSVTNILSSYCNSCHSTANSLSAGGGVTLDTYSGAKTYALSGQLVSALRPPNTGYPATMPPGSQIDDCKVTTLKKWVQAGAPDN